MFITQSNAQYPKSRLNAYKINNMAHFPPSHPQIQTNSLLSPALKNLQTRDHPQTLQYPSCIPPLLKNKKNPPTRKKNQAQIKNENEKKIE